MANEVATQNQKDRSLGGNSIFNDRDKWWRLCEWLHAHPELWHIDENFPYGISFVVAETMYAGLIYCVEKANVRHAPERWKRNYGPFFANSRYWKSHNNACSSQDQIRQRVSSTVNDSQVITDSELDGNQFRNPGIVKKTDVILKYPVLLTDRRDNVPTSSTPKPEKKRQDHEHPSFNMSNIEKKNSKLRLKSLCVSDTQMLNSTQDVTKEDENLQSRLTEFDPDKKNDDQLFDDESEKVEVSKKRGRSRDTDSEMEFQQKRSPEHSKKKSRRSSPPANSSKHHDKSKQKDGHRHSKKSRHSRTPAVDTTTAEKRRESRKEKRRSATRSRSPTTVNKHKTRKSHVSKSQSTVDKSRRTHDHLDSDKNVSRYRHVEDKRDSKREDKKNSSRSHRSYNEVDVRDRSLSFKHSNGLDEAFTMVTETQKPTLTRLVRSRLVGEALKAILDENFPTLDEMKAHLRDFFAPSVSSYKLRGDMVAEYQRDNEEATKALQEAATECFRQGLRNEIETRMEDTEGMENQAASDTQQVSLEKSSDDETSTPLQIFDQHTVQDASKLPEKVMSPTKEIKEEDKDIWNDENDIGNNNENIGNVHPQKRNDKMMKRKKPEESESDEEKEAKRTKANGNDSDNCKVDRMQVTLIHHQKRSSLLK
ncbi:hypothetical protein TKK_0003871 [Trichogramma kaykai]